MALRTDAGRRDANEDSVLSMRLANGTLVVAVADGMGGLELGDVASRTALEAMRNAMTQGKTLDVAMREANRAVHARAAGRPMGTTLVAAQAVGSRVTVANVGDSRAYRCTPLGLRRISVDHTHGEEARQAGAAAPAGALGDRWASALSRSLGTAPEVEVDVFGPFEADDGESILLCSDGVHGVLSDDRIESLLQGLEEPDATVEKVLRAALGAGSEDNVSAVLIHRPPRKRGMQPAALRKSGAAWDPKVLVERSPVRASRSGTAIQIVLGLVAVATLAAAAAAAWLMMR